MQNSLSTCFRKKNEIITSNILTKQSDLQNILKSKFKIDTKK